MHVSVSTIPRTGALQRSVDVFRRDSGVTGVSVAVVEGDGTVEAAASGVADAVTGRALLPSDRMRAASVSKTMTAAAVLQLVDAGRTPKMVTGHLHDHSAAKRIEPATQYWGNSSLVRSVFAGGDAQLVTTAAGLARWGAELLGSSGRALSGDARQRLLRSVDDAPVSAGGLRYGHGVFRVDLTNPDGTTFPTYGHNGAAAGYRSLLLHAPQTDRTVAIQVNEQGFEENEMWILAQELLGTGGTAPIRQASAESTGGSTRGSDRSSG